NSDYVPASMKSKWAENVSASFGIYDESGELYEDVDMNPAIWRDTIVNAMQYADDYVWAYTETYDWWGAPVMWYPQPETPVPDAWVDATRQAMNSFK
ncbi:MAG: hypothetical protein L0H36_01890, partial [bacterium]|nr:hypothetical protein [bacterium]